MSTNPPRPKFSQAFAAVLGERHGVASEAALFAADPRPTDRQEVQRLTLSVSRGHFQVAVDGLARSPELILQRPLAVELVDHLAVEACAQLAERLRRDTAAWLGVVCLAALVADDELADALTDARELAVAPTRAWLTDALASVADGAPIPQEQELRDTAAAFAFAHLTQWARRLWTERADTQTTLGLLGEDLAAGHPDAQHWVSTDAWAEVAASLTGGLADHNLDASRQRLRARLQTMA